eukprot:CAMPEP_0183720282 /NCGR_PEP_ID=MMETSP0737-20130205/12943_1 /TAXON_ID=385413 /ORGANISM="Thalassiosira miniscula, Strain CCMP1093" /LENGTH=564 /DNA_ID=CAMNT_0025950127 /DNA_START=41 /DNA_END=1735 /DNA_ORIENTATION=-
MTIANTTFIHFNDVYNVEQAAPFVASIKETRKKLLAAPAEKKEGQVITFFSGDAFSPSLMSTILRGEQMVPVLNAVGIDVTCLGNHDLDFGLQEFRELKDQCNFPWLCSNAWDAKLNEPLGGCHEYYILDKTKEGGPRLLVIGLVEGEWFEIMPSLDPQDVIFEPPIDFVKRRIPELKAEHGPFDAVVALTHMRMPNDIALANEVGGIDGVDIVLGGHDHHYEDIVSNNVRILNSGTDFHNYTIVEVQGRDASGKFLETTTRRVDVGKNDPPDEGVVEAIQQYRDAVESQMDMVIGRAKVALDARFSQIRTKETNVGNFLAELMVRATGADVALFNSGTIRADRILEKGEMTLRDLCELLPESGELSVIEVTAEILLQALENGVSKYPAMEGRFPCVDGVRFAFDPTKPAGSRVVPGSVYMRDKTLVKKRHTLFRGQQIAIAPEDVETKSEQLNGTAPKGYSPLDLGKTYKLVTRAFCAEGKDGYSSLADAPKVDGCDELPLLQTLVRNIFTELRTLEYWRGMTVSLTVVRAATKFKRLARRSVADPYAINPQLDGRIVNVAED